MKEFNIRWWLLVFFLCLLGLSFGNLFNLEQDFALAGFIATLGEFAYQKS